MVCVVDLRPARHLRTLLRPRSPKDLRLVHMLFPDALVSTVLVIGILG